MSGNKTKKLAEEGEKRRSDVVGSIEPPLDGVLTAWLVRQFRDEQPQTIDWHPINGRSEKEERLGVYNVKPTETIGAEKAAAIANDIFSECQLNCDARGKKKSYIVRVIDTNRGGLANPVGSHLMPLEPRHGMYARVGGNTTASDSDEEEGEVLSARKFMMESVKLVHEEKRFEQENQGRIVGDTMMLQLRALEVRDKALVDRDKLILESHQKLMGMVDKFLEMSKAVASGTTEQKALEIEAANAAENRKDQASRRERDGMWVDVQKHGLIKAVDMVSTALPSIGNALLAALTGKEVPDPPQLGAPAPSTTAATAASTNGQPQLPAAPEEKVLIERFVTAARAHRIDADHTAAEKLFGKDDDKTGAILETGVFSREQVNLLSGVSTGRIGIEALDGLIPGSGKPETLTIEQLFRAVPYLTPAMKADFDKIVELRQKAQAAASSKPSN